MGAPYAGPPDRTDLMRFPYRPYIVQGTTPNATAMVFRPMVPVRVISSVGDRDVLCRADTGADDTLLPHDLVTALGITGLSPPVNVGSLGGNILAEFGTVDLEISDGQATYRWAAYVGFHTSSLYRSTPVVGLKGFLQFFTATFDGQFRHLDLVPNGLAAPPSVTII
jgi:hypothetical protein